MSAPEHAQDDEPGAGEPDPVVRAYLGGIDRTLIAKNLRLTPEQRLLQLMALQRMAAELRRAGREGSRWSCSACADRSSAPTS
ncbi:MAG: hypothetical protein OZ948_07740 [Deltaproteobacteria bacterium]|nr:hypothetical protein [Deltaproteobacteria bacterium]